MVALAERTSVAGPARGFDPRTAASPLAPAPRADEPSAEEPTPWPEGSLVAPSASLLVAVPTGVVELSSRIADVWFWAVDTLFVTQMRLIEPLKSAAEAIGSLHEYAATAALRFPAVPAADATTTVGPFIARKPEEGEMPFALLRPVDQGEALWTRALAVFGAAIAEAIATGAWPEADPQEIGGHRPLDRVAEARLRSALAIARWLLTVEAQDTIRSWFVGKNPILGDRAPAIVIAEDPEKVRRAARDLVAHG
jgi:hypothetical protein